MAVRHGDAEMKLWRGCGEAVRSGNDKTDNSPDAVFI